MSIDRPYGSPQWQILTNGFDDGGGGGISEAPTDGQTYGRVGATASWTPIVTTGGGIGEAPTDGQLYSRRGSTASWVVSPTGGGGGSGLFIGDAPPASPTVGQLWWHSGQGNTYLWYIDPSGPPGQWVQQNGTKGEKGDVGATGAQGPQGDVGPAGPTGTTDWNGIVNKPATFPPSAHSHVIADTTGLQAALDAKEPTIAAGTAAQYWKGTKVWATLDKAAVGLGNVDNTSDASKPVSTATQTVLNLKQDLSAKGVASGYASLDSGGKVPAAQLPAYVDDVLEYANLAAFPATGTAGVLYLALDTNKIYRWTGSVYVEISPTTGVPSPSDVLPVMDGTALAGVSALWSRGDHVHPTDTSRLAATHAGTGGTAHANVVAAGAAGFMTGADKAKLDGIATGANLYVHPTGDGNLHVPVTGTVSNGMVLKAGATAGSGAWAALAQSDISGLTTALSGKEPTIAGGTTAQYWRGDKTWVAFPTTMTPSAHVHPQSEVTNLVADLALKAPLASPVFSGIPTAPTAGVGTSTLQLATTAFVQSAVTAAGGAAPSNALPLMDGTATIGTSLLYAREGHIHPSDTSRQAFITAGTTAQYWRGDKSWQTLDKASVGLGNVDNTSDANKPISTAEAAADALRVLKAGDTMSGNLTLTMASPTLVLNKTSGGAGIWGRTSGITRWSMYLGDSTAEGGSNAGSDFSLWRHDATTGSAIGTAPVLKIRRSDGDAVATGNLTIEKVEPYLLLKKTAAAQVAAVYGSHGANNRWTLVLGDNSAESGSNAGSNFSVNRWTDGGVLIDAPLAINRATGNVSLYHTLIGSRSALPAGAEPGQVIATSLTTASSVGFNSYLNTGAAAWIAFTTGWGGLQAFDKATGKYNWYIAPSAAAGATHALAPQMDLAAGGHLSVGGNMTAFGEVIAGTTAAGQFTSKSWSGLAVVSSTGSNPTIVQISQGNPAWSIIYHQLLHYPGVLVANRVTVGSVIFDFRGDGQAYKTGGGVWGDTSDERIKTVKEDYTHGLDEIMQLQPVVYTFKGNDTDAPPSGEMDGVNADKPRKAAPKAAPFPNSPHYNAAVEKTEFVGLIAQQVEAAGLIEMVKQRNGYIDGQRVADLRDLDQSALVFALINGMKTQQAMIMTLTERIEILEAR